MKIYRTLLTIALNIGLTLTAGASLADSNRQEIWIESFINFDWVDEDALDDAEIFNKKWATKGMRSTVFQIHYEEFFNSAFAYVSCSEHTSKSLSDAELLFVSMRLAKLSYYGLLDLGTNPLNKREFLKLAEKDLQKSFSFSERYSRKETQDECDLVLKDYIETFEAIR